MFEHKHWGPLFFFFDLASLGFASSLCRSTYYSLSACFLLMNEGDYVWSCRNRDTRLANLFTENLTVVHAKRERRSLNEVNWRLLALFVICCFACCCLQDSETLLSLCRSEGGAISLSLGKKAKSLPSSPFLLLHFHGGGFVAQTSKSHEVSWLPIKTPLFYVTSLFVKQNHFCSEVSLSL